MGMFNRDHDEEKFFGDLIIKDYERKHGTFVLAFRPDTTVYSPTSPLREGVARTLREIAALVEKGINHGGIRDINGDVIGSWEFKEPLK